MKQALARIEKAQEVNKEMATDTHEYAKTAAAQKSGQEVIQDESKALGLR